MLSRVVCTTRAITIVVGLLISFCAVSEEAVRIAFIDPLSGPFANTGELALKHFQAAATREDVRRKMGGRRIEVVAFDNKGSVQETATLFQRVVDQGIRYVVQGQSSAAALALLHLIELHNARHPDRSVLFLNYAALDPDLTNAKCSFWHFRFDANVYMRMSALLSTVLESKRQESIYLINQDYSFGHHVARTARELIVRQAGASKIVGEDLHAIGVVRDFSPYIQKAKRTGATVIITGNWGTDLTLLIKAGREIGFKGRILSFYAGVPGAVTAVGNTEAGRILQVNEWHPNVIIDGVNPYAKVAAGFKLRFGEELYFPRIYTLIEFFASAIQLRPSGQPLEVAFALEGMQINIPTGSAVIRREDHQLIHPLYVSTLAPAARLGGPRDVLQETERTGMGFLTLRRFEGEELTPPTTCVMSRPLRGNLGR